MRHTLPSLRIGMENKRRITKLDEILIATQGFVFVVVLTLVTSGW